jgi:hypothetical protein
MGAGSPRRKANGANLRENGAKSSDAGANYA